MCGHRGQFLTSALALCVANDVLISMDEKAKKKHHAAEHGIQVINDLRSALRRITGKDKILFSSRLESFDSYDQMMLLKRFVKEAKWTTWNEDLEQWMVHREELIDKFTQLNGEFLWAHRNEMGGCF